MCERNANKKLYGETPNMKNLKKKLVYLWQSVLAFLCYSYLLTLLEILINAIYLCQQDGENLIKNHVKSDLRKRDQ